MDGWEGEEGLKSEGKLELSGYSNTPLRGEILSVGNLYCVHPHPTPLLSVVCNIELFSKRMNVSCLVFFFSFFPFFFIDGEE